MGKYTKYSSNYPSVYTPWMYPPKNTGLFKYLGITMRGFWKSNASDFKASWTYGIAAAAVLYAWYRVSKASRGSKFSQSIRDEKGNWLYGPPSQKFLDELHEHKILHATHK